MLKEALQYLISLGNVNTVQVGTQTYATQPLHLVKEPVVAPIDVRSLSGLIEYIKSEFDGTEKLMVHVVSPTKVVAFTQQNGDAARKTFITATAMVPEFAYGRFHQVEEFIISLQAGFVPYGNHADILKLVGNIKEENVQQFGDDGVSQAVTAKMGIAAVETVKVPNPVVLKPFRTFVEIDQPESEFVFRLKNGPTAALFEADGGAWKIAAMQSIREHLAKELAAELADGRIVIIA